MHIIKNFDSLAISPDRKTILELIEKGLESIQPEQIIQKSISLSEDTLTIKGKTIDLSVYNRIFLIGFGKGSALNSKIIEEELGSRLTKGYVIDVISEEFKNIEFTKGTHPLPSEQNIKFAKTVTENLSSLTEKDLVLVVVCGGGSALFELPYNKTLEEQTKIFQALLKSGANIHDMNIVRKHLSRVKGGGLAKILYPATIISLIFSDVPGNDLSVIASAPTVKDPTTIEDALETIKKYHLEDLGLTSEDFTQTPKEEKYFEKTSNIFIVSNQTILKAIKEEGEKRNLNVRIFSDKLEGEAREIGKKLIAEANSGEILLAGGETTVTVKDKTGKGGRNQEVVLGGLSEINEKILLISFGTDGRDNSEFAGAIGDKFTVKKSKEQNLNLEDYLNHNNSYLFFKKVGDGLTTDRLPSNVADIMIVWKK